MAVKNRSSGWVEILILTQCASEHLEQLHHVIWVVMRVHHSVALDISQEGLGSAQTVCFHQFFLVPIIGSCIGVSLSQLRQAIGLVLIRSIEKLIMEHFLRLA